MWVQHTNNYLCNYLDQYEVQKKHIQRILTAKNNINDGTPYYPRFLQLRLGKNQYEEEKNHIIGEENRNLFNKITNAIIKPSKYSRIFEPKECPSFNKQIMGFKRIKKEIQNYHENIRFYNRLDHVKSFYDINEIKERNKNINKDIKNLQKSILELQPSLFFLSPQSVERGMKKITYINLNKSKVKRCNSCKNRNNSKILKKKKKNNFFTDTSNKFNSYLKINIDDKIKKVLINPISKKNVNNNISNRDRSKSKKIKNKFNNDINNSKIKNKKKIEKLGLKRNKSELNIFD